MDPSLQNLISTSAALGVYAFAFTTGCTYLNIDTTPFVGLFGVGGAALGFVMLIPFPSLLLIGSWSVIE